MSIVLPQKRLDVEALEVKMELLRQDLDTVHADNLRHSVTGEDSLMSNYNLKATASDLDDGLLKPVDKELGSDEVNMVSFRRDLQTIHF